MKQNICDKGEHVLKYWTEQYFLKDLTPFQKRLFDWWVGEGFFCVSNYQNTEDGTKADLMLLVGKSVYQVLGHLEDISSEIGFLFRFHLLKYINITQSLNNEKYPDLRVACRGCSRSYQEGFQ